MRFIVSPQHVCEVAGDLLAARAIEEGRNPYAQPREGKASANLTWRAFDCAIGVSIEWGRRGQVGEVIHRISPAGM
jgi:hypothetical protein